MTDLSLRPRLHVLGRIFDLCNPFTRIAANSVTDCCTVRRSKICTVPRVPFTKGGSVQVFVRSKICPDPFKRGLKSPSFSVPGRTKNQIDKFWPFQNISIVTWRNLVFNLTFEFSRLKSLIKELSDKRDCFRRFQVPS